MTDQILYCLTRDLELADALEGELDGAIAFFYNDAARLHQAVTLRPPNVVLIDTGAIRAEYGDAGLGPVVDFLRQKCPGAAILVRPTEAAMQHLIAAEAGHDVEIVPSPIATCVKAVAARS